MDVQVFSDYKSQDPGPATSVLGAVKEPTQLSKRVGHAVHSVVVWLVSRVGFSHRVNLILPFYMWNKANE